MVKHSQTSNVIWICLVIGLISLTSCSILELDRVLDQLDRKVKGIFNEDSLLSNYRTINKDNSKLYYMEYESGLKATVSVNSKSVSIV